MRQTQCGDLTFLHTEHCKEPNIETLGPFIVTSALENRPFLRSSELVEKPTSTADGESPLHEPAYSSQIESSPVSAWLERRSAPLFAKHLRCCASSNDWDRFTHAKAPVSGYTP
jgi:hypothetical protein